MTDEEYIKMSTKIEEDKNSLYRGSNNTFKVILLVLAVFVIGAVLIYFCK